MRNQKPIKTVSGTLSNVKKQLESNYETSTIPAGQSEVRAESVYKERKLSHDTVVLINMLFARFHHIYTHKFESAYRDTDTTNLPKKEWALSLADFNQSQIELAIHR